MDKQEFDATMRALEASRKKHTASPEAARAYLRRLGLIDENGDLTPEYGGPERKQP